MEPQHQHQHDHCPNPEISPPPSTTTTSVTCCAKCGGPTAFAPPPEISPPPNYRPIRAPAINLPPNNHSQAIILAPVPQSQKVPTISPPFHFQIPSKRIHSPDDIRHFIDSDSGKNFLGFVVALSESIRGHKISDAFLQSHTINTIISIIAELIQWVDEIPPAQQSGRYGNVAYRTWHSRLVESSESLMLRFLPNELQASTVEIVPYFTDSFGNSSRIDYGTGHETNFAAWLYCLARMGVVKEEDYQAVISRVFVKYLELMRKLQLVYCLEPAGSHGVWGLDDYHFLPFIFGSSQLIDHKYMKPKSIHNQDILDNFSNEFMYLSCIAFVKKVKKGLFAEHSPLLDDISGVPNWNKVNSGLLKMYKAEVLEKVPIMQHFLFGWLIKWFCKQGVSNVLVFSLPWPDVSAEIIRCCCLAMSYAEMFYDFLCINCILSQIPSLVIPAQKLIKSQTLADNIKYFCSGFFGPCKQNKIGGLDDASVLMEYMQWQDNCIQEGFHLTENRG